MTDRALIDAVAAGGPFAVDISPDERASVSVRRLIEERLRQRFPGRLLPLVQNQVDLDLRPEGGPYERVTVRIDAARRSDFFWTNARESFLQERVDDAGRVGARATLLACQLPPRGDRLLLWQIDMHELLDARRRAQVPADTALFKIEPRPEGGWELCYAGQHVLDLDVTSPHGSVPLEGLSVQGTKVASALIDRVSIRGFKSIVDQSIDLGRLNVLIGANGSGKSVLLEALGVLGAAVSGRIDDASLTWRGVRLGALRLYRGAFRGERDEIIALNAAAASTSYDVTLDPAVASPDRTWSYLGESVRVGERDYLQRSTDSASFSGENGATHEFGIDVTRGAARTVNPYDKVPGGVSRMLDALESFVIFDPQTPILRGTQTDPAPLGLGGGKLAELARTLLHADPEKFGLMPRDELFELLGWASDVTVGPPSPELSSPAIPAATEIVRFTDRYLRREGDGNVLSGYDASEGALYVLFVLTLLFHPSAPPFFAIENINHALHPRVARKLVDIIARHVALAERQILLTTHNPLVLDALPLADDTVRLFAVDRNAGGHTVVRRVAYTEAIKIAVDRGLTLSQMWTRGLLGAVPDIG